MNAALATEALNQPLGHRQAEPELPPIHTDQGSQYRTTDYRNQLRKHEIARCISAKSRQSDNTRMKSPPIHPEAGTKTRR